MNCDNELLPERALARAEKLDDYYALHKKPIGPLHGLPISVKSHIGRKGCGTNCGFIAWGGRTSPDDALILQILLAAGAVLYVQTTEPQGLVCQTLRRKTRYRVLTFGFAGDDRNDQ